MSSSISADLAAICSGLGYFDSKENKYYADSNTLESVKELIRCLRRDDEKHDIRRILGDINVVQTDLLQLLKNYWEETEIFEVVLRLLVNLTTPALMLWNEEPPKDRVESNHYLEIEEHLRCYKQGFADEAVWAVLSTRISKILEIDYAERGDENGLIIERILILIRNILYVPADPDAERRTDNDASIHDQVLWALHQSGMLDIILYMTSSTNEQVYYMHILEILAFMLREQSASELASAALHRSETEKIRDEAELLAIRHRENNKKQQKVKKYGGSRHSNFGGTFVVKSMKSISDNELIYHKPLENLESLKFDGEKRKSKIPSRFRAIQGREMVERKSAFSIRLFLKEFCVDFLNGAYNVFMHHAKDKLVRARAQQHDESYYLWALRFFMEFNRGYKFEVKLVSETMSVQSFHFVQQQMEKFFDMISSDKKKLHLWSRRLHLALLAYRELLLTICMMDKSQDVTVRDSARVIKSNIFYILEYRELVLTLLVTYDEIKMSFAYLRDLIETQHIFLKLLENYCGGNSGRVMVQTKNKKRNKKVVKESIGPVELNLDNMWDEVSTQLSAVLAGHLELPNDVVPFDAGSDVPIDEQKDACMKNIQRKLRHQEFENAVALLRAAREVWPENDSFGFANMSAEDEFLALRDIFFTDLGENQLTSEPQESNEYEEDEEDEFEDMVINETDLKFEDITKRLAHPRIVRACGLALKDFEKNSVLTNHCITKLLHRIAFDCKMSAMVFQVSIFMTFEKIYEVKALPQYKELVKFATYIIRQFFKIASKNEHVFMESLFWKSNRDAYDIVEGYGTYQKKSGAGSKAWTELEEDELKRLFMEHKESGNEEDVVDWITENLIDNTHTRRQVLKKLKELHLLVNYKNKKSAVSRKYPKQWGIEEEAQLAELYEQFRDAMDPLGCIMDRLDIKRPKNRIIEKLLVMGLVQDKKELRKKRTRKSQTRRGFEANDSHTSDSDDGGDEERRPGGSSYNSSTSRNKQSSNPSAGKSQKTSKGPRKSSDHVRASSGDLAKMLISLADAGNTDALEWIKECFEDEMEDWESLPEDESIPIVPISDYAVTAMENTLFLNLLKAFGLKAPSDEQEIYWRIPSYLSIADLKSYCELLSKAIDGTLVAPTEHITEVPKESEENSSDEDVFEKLKKFTAPPLENLEEDNTNKEETIPTPKKSNPIAEKIFEKSKTTSNTQSTSTNKNLKSDTPSSSKKYNIKEIMKKKKNEQIDLEIIDKSPKYKKKRIQIADSSDEEERIFIPPEENEENRLSFKPTRITDSDDEDFLQKRNVNLDSDEEMSKKSFKQMNVLQSDSENEDKENVDDNLGKENVENKRIRSASDSDSDKPRVKRSRAIISDDEDD